MENSEIIQIEVTQLRKHKKGSLPRGVNQVITVIIVAFFALGLLQSHTELRFAPIFDFYFLMFPLFFINILQLRKKNVPLTLETDGKYLRILSQSGANLYDSRDKEVKILEHALKNRLYLLIDEEVSGKIQKIEIVFNRDREVRLIKSLGSLLNEGRD
jgi:hypothetical protein